MAPLSAAPPLARSARRRYRRRARYATKMKVKGARTKNMDKLIAAVQARECLWDKSYRGHRNRFKLERYWNEVAAEVGTTSEYRSVLRFTARLTSEADSGRRVLPRAATARNPGCNIDNNLFVFLRASLCATKIYCNV